MPESVTIEFELMRMSLDEPVITNSTSEPVTEKLLPKSSEPLIQ